MKNMVRFIHCSRCGEITEELTINKKTIKNCKQCRDAHNNKVKQKKNNTDLIQEELTHEEEKEYIEEQRSDTTQEQHEEQEQQEGQKQEEQEQQETEKTQEQEETAEQIEPTKNIKKILEEIYNNIKALEEIGNIHQTNINDILTNLNVKLDNVINSVSNTTINTDTNNNNDELKEFIKKQQLQNKIITNKLDNLIKAIT